MIINNIDKLLAKFKFGAEFLRLPRFSFDIGSSMIRVGITGKGVFEEPNIIAYHVYKDKYLFYGKEAEELVGKLPKVVKIIFPVQKGVIHDFDALFNLISLIKEEQIMRLWKDLRFVFPFTYALVSIPSFATEIEQKAAQEILKKIGFNKVFLIPSAVAIAYSLVSDIFSAEPFVILDVGAGKTEACVVSRGGIILSRWLDIGGYSFDEKIKNYLHLKYAIIIGRYTAEKVKKDILLFNGKDKKTVVKGKALDTGLPKEVKISTSEVREAIFPLLGRIIEQVKDLIEEIPPEIIGDITKKGIYLTGGLANIPAVEKYLQENIGIKVNKPAGSTKLLINGLMRVSTERSALSAISLPDIE